MNADLKIFFFTINIVLKSCCRPRTARCFEKALLFDFSLTMAELHKNKIHRGKLCLSFFFAKDQSIFYLVSPA
jgi:hypothetical protein